VLLLRQPESATRLYAAADRIREQMGFGSGWFAATLDALIRRDKAAKAISIAAQHTRG
jgi:hypothetical protein